jgi:hypothetical protein
MLEENISEEDQRRLQEANNIFRGAVLNILVDHLVDANLHIQYGKELWDHL